ncbi:hypothetical protein KIPB_010603, partial [Kipferlia bialata]|eukprot:g10603.t1
MSKCPICEAGKVPSPLHNPDPEASLLIDQTLGEFEHKMQLGRNGSPRGLPYYQSLVRDLQLQIPCLRGCFIALGPREMLHNGTLQRILDLLKKHGSDVAELSLRLFESMALGISDRTCVCSVAAHRAVYKKE